MIQFILTGNQEDMVGNPIPYHRTTQRSYWNKGSRRYQSWKTFVRQQYWLQTKKRISDDKPFDKSFCGRLEITIEFRGENHADPDNIVKGIADALFENDKHVDVATKHACNAKKGKVIINIEAYPQN